MRMHGQSNPLVVAILRGNAQAVQCLLSSAGIDPNQPDQFTGQTPLRAAYDTGNRDIFALLLRDLRVDVDRHDEFNWNLLMRACLDGKAWHVDMLHACRRRISSLHWKFVDPVICLPEEATQADYDRIRRTLIDYRFDPDATRTRLRHSLGWIKPQAAIFALVIFGCDRLLALDRS